MAQQILPINTHRLVFDFHFAFLLAFLCDAIQRKEEQYHIPSLGIYYFNEFFLLQLSCSRKDYPYTSLRHYLFGKAFRFLFRRFFHRRLYDHATSLPRRQNVVAILCDDIWVFVLCQ